MGLAEAQRLLARLSTDAPLRARFADDPAGVAAEFGLSPEEAGRLADFPDGQIEEFARSLIRKRRGEVGSLLPLTSRAVGPARLAALFLRHARAFVPGGIKKHRDDAVAFAASLAGGAEVPPWVAELARFEGAALLAHDPARRWVALRLGYHPADLARSALGDGAGPEAEANPGGLVPPVEGGPVAPGRAGPALVSVENPRHRRRGAIPGPREPLASHDDRSTLMRKFRMIRQFFGCAVVAGLAAFGASRAEAGFLLTANDAKSQASTVSGVTTENFDSFAASRYTSLTTAVGTLSSPGLQVVSKDQYGAAGGLGDYFSIGAQSGQTSATLTLNGPQAYFGFWWSAADALNQIQFLSGGRVVASFDSASALGSLGPAYDGNPNGGDSGEKFAYLNLIGTAGSTFDQIVFSNASTGTGFESDNWSVRAAPLDSPYPGTVIGSPSVVPEPSSLVLTASGVLGLIGLARRRRQP